MNTLTKTLTLEDELKKIFNYYKKLYGLKVSLVFSKNEEHIRYNFKESKIIYSIDFAERIIDDKLSPKLLIYSKKLNFIILAALYNLLRCSSSLKTLPL